MSSFNKGSKQSKIYNNYTQALVSQEKSATEISVLGNLSHRHIGQNPDGKIKNYKVLKSYGQPDLRLFVKNPKIYD
jgi:hypothetical protein